MTENTDILKVLRFCTISYNVTTYVLCQCVLPVYLVVTKTNIDLPTSTYDLRIFLVIARQDHCFTKILRKSGQGKIRTLFFKNVIWALRLWSCLTKFMVVDLFCMKVIFKWCLIMYRPYGTSENMEVLEVCNRFWF